jgi:hypothetical protein
VSERRALSRAVKRTITVTVMLAVCAGMYYFGAVVGSYLGYFAPLITFPIGFTVGCLTYWKARKWMDSYPTKETMPSD